MKKFYILLIALSLVNFACQREHSYSLRRHNVYGKVTYVTHYPSVKSNLSKVKPHKVHY